MKLRVTALLWGAAFVATLCVSAGIARAADSVASDPFVTNVQARTFTVTGTVVSVRGETMVVRIDDHHHHLPFSLGRGVDKPKVGARVSVRYHPSGETGQVADEVQVLGR
jgi:ferric-dicitrate binding protein FerR (iron transport regulator)